MVAEVGESVVFIMSVGVKAIMPHPPLSVFMQGRSVNSSEEVLKQWTVFSMAPFFIPPANIT